MRPMFKQKSIHFPQLQVVASRKLASLETMSAYKHAVRLLVCVLIICCARLGTQCLQVAAAAAPAATGDSQAGPVGIAFPQNDKAFLVAANSATGERQSESLEDQYQKSAEKGEHWQSKRLRLEYPPSSSVKDLDSKEMLRRVYIENVLDALTESIPPSPKKLRSSQKLALGEPAATSVNSRSSGQQIFRSGRTYPRGSLDASGSGLVKQRWQSNSIDSSMLDGRSSSHNEPVTGSAGIVWVEPNDRYGGKSRPLVTAKQPRSRTLEDQVSQRMLNEMVGGDYRRTPLGHIYQGEVGNRKSHRSGMEEIPIQTPVHSMHSGGDYETKRVENSRGWNNLRGMWGKRSTDANKRFEAQEQEELGVGSSSLEATPARLNDGTSDDYMNAADRDQQTLTSVMQSIRSM